MTQIIRVKNIVTTEKKTIKNNNFSMSTTKRKRKKVVTRIRKRDRMDKKLTEFVPLSQVNGEVFMANLPVLNDGELNWNVIKESE